jgi:hypothetical protein
VRLKEQEDATSALREIGALADAPTAHALGLLGAVLAGRPDSELRRLKARFDEAAEAWNLGYNRSRVLAMVYFNDSLSLAHVDSMVASASRDLAGTLERERDNRLRLADTARLIRDSTRLKEYSRTMKEVVRLDRRAAEGLREAFRIEQRLLFYNQMLWASLISSRQAGSFDPLGRYAMTPTQEARVLDSARKLLLLDSIATVKKAGARPDSR